MSMTSTPPATGTVVHSRRALYVGGLADGVKEDTLRAALIPFGPIKAIDIPMDYAKGTHKGFAFVEFQDSQDAEEALYNMDGAELMGRALNVSLAQQNQIKLGSHQAVWSTDEWFKEQSGEGSGRTADQSESKKTDGASVEANQ